MMHYPLAPYEHNAMQTFGYGRYQAKKPDTGPDPLPPITDPGPKYPPITPDSPWPPKPVDKYRMRRRRGRRGQLSRYRAFGSLEEMADVVGSEVSGVLSRAEEALYEGAQGLVHAVEDSATRQRQRQAIWMVGSPLIILAGLSNRRNRTLGLASAIAGALIGFRNYREYQHIEGLRKQMGV